MLKWNKFITIHFKIEISLQFKLFMYIYNIEVFKYL